VSLVVYLIIKVVGSVGAIFAPDYVTFVIGRFVADIGACGVGLTAFVIGKTQLTTDCHGLYVSLRVRLYSYWE